MRSFLDEEHLLNGNGPAAKTHSLTLTIEGTCASGSESVLERVKDGLRPVVAARAHGNAWPSDAEWSQRLPFWFVDACVPERTPAEITAWMDHWRTLSPKRQAIAAEARAWTLSGWLHWFAPGGDERQWRWFDSGIISSDRFWITIEVEGYPTAYGALRWLLRAAGATDLEEK